MVRRATSSLLVWLLITSFFVFSPVAKAQTASPSTATIAVSGVPAGTTSLAVELTIDSTKITLASASSDAANTLAVTGTNGVGIIATSGTLPASFNITLNISGVAEGTSALTVGNVVTTLAAGGTAIAGASATSTVSSVTVAGGSSSSSSSSSTGGIPGNLDNDTVNITITGDAVKSTNALTVTLAFGDSGVASLASTSPTFSADGATQLLSSSTPDTQTVSVVWDGTITGNSAMIAVMLAAGDMAGTTSVAVSKVLASGGLDITDSVVSQVDPSEVTNGSSASTDCGSFTLIGPSKALVAPGAAAVAVSIENPGSGLMATINGETVEITSSNGVAIVDVTSAGELDLSLSASCSAGSSTVDLGSLSVSAATDGAKAPTAKRATVKNTSSMSNLMIVGNNLAGADIELLPTDRSSSNTGLVAKKKSIKATFDSANCLPNGTFVNVITTGGTAARKLKVMGACSNTP